MSYERAFTYALRNLSVGLARELLDDVVSNDARLAWHRAFFVSGGRVAAELLLVGSFLRRPPPELRVAALTVEAILAA